MNITELIAALQVLRDEHGPNVQVARFSGGRFIPINPLYSPAYFDLIEDEYRAAETLGHTFVGI